MDYRKTAGVIAVITPLWFLCVYLVMAGLRPEYSYMTKAISELGSVHAPHKWFWNVLGYVLPGLAIVFLGMGLGREFSDTSRYAWIPVFALAASGLCMVAAGIFPGNFVNRSATTMILHAVGSLGSGFAFLIAGFGFPMVFRKKAHWHWVVWPTLALVIAFVLSVVATGALRSIAMPGLGQRLGFACFFLWIGLAGLALARSSGLGKHDPVPINHDGRGGHSSEESNACRNP